MVAFFDNFQFFANFSAISLLNAELFADLIFNMRSIAGKLGFLTLIFLTVNKCLFFRSGKAISPSIFFWYCRTLLYVIIFLTTATSRRGISTVARPFRRPLLIASAVLGAAAVPLVCDAAFNDE